ncbi:hypothetical protein PROFUN_01060 [Planoprotostelium fungivorum]|uniref:Uncharacterized protein n=1 Tax=Planoprotostelium fungivorum TaxID=1890364 RepID=A0A2P6N4L0_9EUKA|nr:hypothetical protein PROFUN_01060 [Planoprotostelium fungivorum]
MSQKLTSRRWHVEGGRTSSIEWKGTLCSHKQAKMMNKITTLIVLLGVALAVNAQYYTFAQPPPANTGLPNGIFYSGYPNYIVQAPAKFIATPLAHRDTKYRYKRGSPFHPGFYPYGTDEGYVTPYDIYNRPYQGMPF